MKRSRFTEEHIIGILQWQEAAVAVADMCHRPLLADPDRHRAEGLVVPQGPELKRPSGSRRTADDIARRACPGDPFGVLTRPFGAAWPKACQGGSSIRQRTGPEGSDVKCRN